MKILSSKFLISIIVLISIVVWLEFYNTHSSYSQDKLSYVTLKKWNWVLTKNWENIILRKEEKYKIDSWDKIKTLTNSSLAIINWWDSSVTRVWWKSEIIIKENFISEDLNQIKIDFSLEKWKSWSNVTTMIWKDSYFNQSFGDVIAWVRWTTFEVNIDSNYLSVHKHEVTLTDINTNSKTKVIEWEYFNYNTFKKLEQKVKDKLWQELNDSLDIEYLKSLRDSLNTIKKSYNPFEKLMEIISPKYRVFYEVDKDKPSEKKINEVIIKLNNKEKNEVYNYIIKRYQKLNFIDSSWEDLLLDKKVILRNIIYNLENDETQKENIIRYSYYDLQESINSWDLKASNIIIKAPYIKESLEDIKKINNKLKWKLGNKLDNAVNSIDFFDELGKDEIDKKLDEAKNKIEDIDTSLNNKVHNTLDSIFNKE